MKRRQPLYNTGLGQVTSLRVDTETDPIERVQLTTIDDIPANTRIDYWVSNNGGDQWFQLKSGEDIIFPTTGTDLRWRAKLYSQSPTASPRLDEVNLVKRDIPIADLAASNNSPMVIGLPTTLNATISEGSNATYTWDLGDGNTGSGASVIHTYASLGTYTAVVTAKILTLTR